jgi:hypothetical protein
VIFLGDGCLGVGEKDCGVEYQTQNSFNKDVFAAFDFENPDHFWVMVQYPSTLQCVMPDKTLEFKAIDTSNTLKSDSYYQIDMSKLDL